MDVVSWTRTGAVAVALAATAAVAVAAVQQEPVALLVKLQGGVTVEPADTTAAAVPGAVGLQLVPGDRVVVAEGGEAVVLYRTGRLVKAAAPVTIEAVGAAEASGLFASTVRTLGQVATTDARTQPNRQGMIRPIAGAPAPIAPRNGIKVLDVRPTFTWFRVGDADAYIVQLQREGTDAPAPVRYSAGSDTTWTYPADEPALVPGATYVWTVGSPVGRVAPPQRFTVAGPEDVAAVQAGLDALIDAGLDPAGDGLFLAALAYRDAGLHYEAIRAIRALEAAGAPLGPTFYQLKGDVLDALGRIEAAAEAFERADREPGA
ncbi:MAG: hypothetical protein R3314_07715 [Longimicrobiales bacterium]|nr:hypothetical protein [Longimicrobiales bacterium]